MLLVYVIMNLCISGKLNKIFILIGVQFLIYGGEAFAAKLVYCQYRG